MSADRENLQRLFFSLWPEPEVAAEIAAARRACGIRGRAVGTGKLHLTLSFLGDVGPSTVDRLLEAAGKIAVPSFALDLARIGYFARPRIVWLGPAAVPAALWLLAAEVEAIRHRVGIEPEKRRFRPHVTLARRAQKPARMRAPEVISWPVSAFHLTESVRVDGGSVYRDLGRWPLTV